MTLARRLGFLGLCLAAGAGAARGEDVALGLTDLAAYRAALDGKPGGKAVAVTFRELWDHPGRYEGRRVRVSGRVARRFRQGAVGTFPALAETWAVSPAGDPFCLVSPASAARLDAAPGASVVFEGVYLRRVRYQGGDTARLAPLVVGDRPPVVTAPAPPKPAAASASGSLPFYARTAGLALAVGLGLALAFRHLRGPSARATTRPPGDDPPPEFVDGG